MTYVIAQPCVDLKDRACVDECPVDCIYEGKRMLYIHPDECVDCGACEPVCPVEAIFYEDDTPEQWKDYYNANVDFFDDLGSPGGAAKIGVIDKDHPMIAALPARRTRSDRPGRRTATTVPPSASPGGRHVPVSRSGCPDFPWDHLTRVRRAGPGAPRRHRRPLGRHAGRPHARGGAAGAGGGRRLARLPADRRAAPTLRQACGRLARAPLRRHRPRPRRGAADDRLQGADRLAAEPPRPRPGRPRRAPRRWPTRRTRSGARLAGARAVATDSLTAVGPGAGRAGLDQLAVQPDRPGAAASSTCARWSPGAASAARCWSPTSATSSAPGRRRRARSRVLHPDVCDGDHTGILAVHSLSKRSNLAGYRCAFVAGDPAVVGELLAVRKNLGLQMPGPQQVAMRAALDDDEHVAEQHARYAAPAGRPAGGARGRGLPGRPLRGVALPVGDPGRALLGHRGLAGRARHPGGAGGVLRPGRRAARAGRVHRHRRAGGGRRTPAAPTADARRSAGDRLRRRAGTGIGVAPCDRRAHRRRRRTRGPRRCCSSGPRRARCRRSAARRRAVDGGDAGPRAMALDEDLRR